ncbi:Expansin/pollen allergen DPBB domain [Arabidopsis thaliana x Arabidopsis arenosa]|uniref:Expansin/pollen allergen DPBB domain n=1 Tax=Arabidopsis thaliana x Arabidopsis arenosa TaxID=1240361 RepID=A0A8T1XYD0_9BRAS|nr:Expansin/pollen allergen DPBB domain [Arabidopsis thaliana x Arabidopsis arenosa]
MEGFLFLLSVVFLFSSSAAACDRCLHRSKAAYFSSASALSSGACAYGSMATGFFAGHIAAALPSIYKDGSGCGACFQVRCTNPRLCSSKGTTVMVTDLNKSNQTDLILSSRAFRAMAKPVVGSDRGLLKQGLVDIEYRRVPCDYGNKKMNVRVEESSINPNYLAIKLLYQGGQTEVVAIDIAQVGSSHWSYMTRSHGAVWVTDKVPTGALQFRFVVTAGYDGKMVWSQRVLPANWEAGKTYDAGVQITDIAQEGCDPCDDHIWN